VVVAARQTAGRGRFGRAWTDTGDDGIAATIVLQVQAAPLQAVAAAVGAAVATEQHLGRPVGIKWPNDLVVGRRKLAGVLIEQAGPLALVGVGVNVNQVAWPASLGDRAVSLLQLRHDGAALDRLAVLESLLLALDRSLWMDDKEVRAAFAARDVLTGRRAVIHAAGPGGGEEIRGQVVQIDPLRGLSVSVDGAPPRWLPAATSTVVEWTAPPGTGEQLDEHDSRRAGGAPHDDGR
jgi:BirA family biotin operon repressor/biotin-[acetyl-CoA-carboxylase] ligase